MLAVDKDGPIKAFVEENGLHSRRGTALPFTKVETIQGHKEIILMDRATGDFFEGEKVRELLGLPLGETTRIRPGDLAKYAVFVQSTSVNRVLLSGEFLYEVSWDRTDTAAAAGATTIAPRRRSRPSHRRRRRRQAPVVVAHHPDDHRCAGEGHGRRPRTGPGALRWAGGGAAPVGWLEGTSSKFLGGLGGGDEPVYAVRANRQRGPDRVAKTFPDEATARKASDKLIAEKVGKGYLEKS